MGFLKKNYFFLFILISILSLSLYSNVYAEIAGPGWLKGEAELLGHDQAATYYSSQKSSQRIPEQSGEISIAAATLYQTEITPEIQELARALHYDPKLIFEYVHNHVDYVPYFGLLKGATLTYLDGSGNDFDQASLMVALMRESANHNAGIGIVQYAYGKMTIPTYSDANDYDMETWLGLGDLGVSSINVVERTLSDGGIIADPVSATTTMDRVCVRAVIGGTPYILDPAFKRYERTEGIDLNSAMVYDRAALLTAAEGSEGSNYIEDLNNINIRSKLDEYTINLIDFLRANYPNASIEEIIGKKKIVPETLVDYTDAIKYSLDTSCTNCDYFDEIDDVYIHTINIEYGLLDPITLSIPEIAGKKLAITYVASAQAASAAAASASSAADNIKAIPIDEESFKSSEEAIIPSEPLAGEGEITPQHHNGTIDFGRINNSGSSYSNWGFNIWNNSGYYHSLIVETEIFNNSSGAFSHTSGGGSRRVYEGETVYVNVRFSGAGQSRGTKTAEHKLYTQWTCYPYGNVCGFPSYDYYYLNGFVAEAPDPSGFHGIDFSE